MILAASWAEKRRAAGLATALPIALVVVSAAPAAPSSPAQRKKTTHVASKTAAKSERRPRVAEDKPSKRRISHKDISAEQELEFIRRCQAGDRRAGEILIQAHDPMIYGAARRWFGRGLDEEDVLQCARIGFLRGIEKFDPEQGTRLSTYVMWWIKQGACRAVANMRSAIRIPVHTHTKLVTALKTGADLSPELEEAWRVRTLSSLDARIGDDADSDTFLDATASVGPSPEDEVAREDARSYHQGLVERAMTALTDRERDIIRRRLLVDEPETFREIAKTHGVNHERVRQIETEALQKLNRILKHTITIA